MFDTMLTPVLALVLWTFAIWFWMYFTPIPAMCIAGMGATKLKRKNELDVLPLAVKQIADNYNHEYRRYSALL